MRTRKATTAASRYGGLRGRLRHTLAALEMRDGPGEQIADLWWGEVTVQETVTRDGNGGGLFRHDQHRRVGLLRQPQRGAVACPQRFVRHLELGQWQHAPGPDDLVAA